MSFALSAPLWVMLALWVACAGTTCFGAWYFQRGLGRPVTLPRGPAVAIVMPVRGTPRHLDTLVAALRAQAYAPWRLVVAVESRADPAFAAFTALFAEGSIDGEIVVAGFATDSVQKVHNQLAGVTRLRPEDRIVVFADADIVPPPDWLPRIVRPLGDPAIAMVSGYRWLVPEDDGIAGAVVSVCNSSFATLIRPRSFNQAWGGTMGLRRETLDALDIESCWRSAVADDGPLRRAVRARGGVVLGPRELLVPTPIALDWPGAIEFGRRQYTFIRLSMNSHWWTAAIALTLPTTAWVVGIILICCGSVPALIAFFVVVVLDQGRAWFRRRAVRILWDEATQRRLSRALWLDRYATPFWLALHAAILWSTLFKRRVRWAGWEYRIDGSGRVTILHRPDPTEN